MTQVLATAVSTFRQSFGGQVLTATDPGYDPARSLWNGCFDPRPAVIARCVAASEVAEAIAFARRHDLDISVRGGGHSFSGVSAADGSLMIDLSQLRDVTVDPSARRVRCGGGTTGADLDAACQQHGLAVTCGMISHTGVAGLTLGGGFGWLTTRMGLSIDNLLAAQVVLADGRCVRASTDEHPDLFWALRGGGGNFGVVTSFEFQLQPLGPEVHVALLFWELDRSVETLRLARDAAMGLTRDASCVIAAGLTAPAAPFVPEKYHFVTGNAMIIAGFTSAEEHRRLIEPIRAALPPLFEFITPMPYTALQQMLDDAAPWGIHAYDRSLYLDALSNEAIDVVAEQLPRKSSPMSFLPILALGGAYRDVDDMATAFGGSRMIRFNFDMAAVAPNPELLAADRAWVRSLWEQLLPFANRSAGYINFMSEYEQERVRLTYGPAKYERLAQIKAKYDPDNVFHLNANIKPAPGGDG
jgi:FAD/FMN-containing dehydrogenase